MIAGTDHVDAGNDQMIPKLATTMGKGSFINFYEIYNVTRLSK